MDTDSTHVRLSAVGIVAISLFLALFVRLWFLQGIDRQEYEAASVTNRLRVIHEEAPRGRILDRNGKVLVDNRTSVVVSLDREPLRKMESDERDELFVELADTLVSFGIPTKVATIEAAYSDTRYAPQAYVPVAEDVPTDVEIYLAERADRFPGVVVERTAVRVYPYGELAVHLLGYVGEINEEELVDRGGTLPGSGSSSTTVVPASTGDGDDDEDGGAAKEYRLGDSIGKTGVEAAYEDDLRGVPGRRTIEVNARGDLVDVVSLDPPRQGDDVWLSIDVDLQAHAEQLLADQLETRAPGVARLSPPQGAVVVQDPRNGQVLAMASYPEYPPDSVVNGISQDYWGLLNDPASGLPLNNWALQGTYAPGSTFKLFPAWAGLRTGLLAGDDVINDTGVYEVENCSGESCFFRNSGSQPHGRVDLPTSLTVSSNVYYYRIADKFWNRWRLGGEFGETPIQDAAREFGLGELSGIELPGDRRGRLPTPAERAEAYEANPDLFMTGEWRSGDNINMAVGQGDVLATPLQLVNAYATFANGGTRYEPRVVTKVTRAIDPLRPPGEEDNHELVREVEPTVAAELGFDPGHYAQIWEGLAGVTQNAGGTVSSVAQSIPMQWPTAGKTGTAQAAGKEDTSLYVGWGPAVPGVEATHAVVAVIPEAGFGSDVAAPIALRALQPVANGDLAPACPVVGRAECEAAKLAPAGPAEEPAEPVGVR